MCELIAPPNNAPSPRCVTAARFAEDVMRRIQRDPDLERNITVTVNARRDEPGGGARGRCPAFTALTVASMKRARRSVG